MRATATQIGNLTGEILSKVAVARLKMKIGEAGFSKWLKDHALIRSGNE
jgi:hypothetical protein